MHLAAIFTVCRFSPVIAAGILLCGSPATGQKAERQPQRASKKSARSSAASLRPGEILELDFPAQTLTFKPRNGAPAHLALTPRTRFVRDRKEVRGDAFKVGDTVVVRSRKSRADSLRVVVEMTDPASWRWLSGLRHTTTRATVHATGEESLIAAVGSDGALCTYLVTDSTLWLRQGKECGPGDFRPGDVVYIVPRGLPGGGTAARAVADSPAEAERARERLARSLHGVLQSIDASARRVSLKTRAGEIRVLQLAETAGILRDDEPIAVSALKPGDPVAVRLKRDETGEDLVTAIRMEKRGRQASRATKRPPLVLNEKEGGRR